MTDNVYPTRRCLLNAAAFSAAALRAGTGRASPGQPVEVIHWWISGGDGEAIRTIRRRVEAGGRTWVDTAVAVPTSPKRPPSPACWGANRPRSWSGKSA